MLLVTKENYLSNATLRWVFFLLLICSGTMYGQGFIALIYCIAIITFIVDFNCILNLNITCLYIVSY